MGLTELDAEQGRVLGSLIEKQLSTPQQYPLTLNALVAACNQTSGRDPVVFYDDRQVDRLLVSLKESGLVRFVHPSHGRSVIRYRQVLEERMALTEEQLALVGVLLLRGPQTVGELRSRTERMATFEGIGHVERELHRLASLPDPLVVRMDRQPGQKEERWAQLLTGEPAAQAPAAMAAAGAMPVRSTAGASTGSAVAELRAQVDKLSAEVADLRAVVDELRAALL